MESIQMEKIGVLFVCTANICRSPMAEGYFRQLVAQRGLTDLFEIDSAGTDGYDNSPPDWLACEITDQAKVNIRSLRSRQVLPGDLRRFDYVLAMTAYHVASLEAIRPPGAKARIHLLLKDFAPQWKLENVPDPYQSRPEHYQRVWGFIRDGVDGFLNSLNLPPAVAETE
ncbi:MAG: low molecular weight phosphotyrosine protein phosphatase [Blastocatellia bacterium]|nr:low molecular weight phosphotyrosine protein phosphatase [Blastocatellia bacterium]